MLKPFPTPQTIFFVGFIFFIMGCASRSKDSTDTALKAQPKQPTAITQVRTAEAVRKPFAFRVLSVGKIEARQHTEVYSRREGIIAKIHLQNGQTIAQGAPIADLDRTELELQVRKAKANLALKQVQYQDKILEYNHKITNESELSPEIKQRFRAVSGLAEAELALQEAELNLSYTRIVAPFAGKVADLKLKEGNRLSPSQVLCILYSSHALEAVTEILESQAGKLQIGQQAEVALTNDEKYAYQATITEINPKVSHNGLVRVKLQLSQAPQPPKGEFSPPSKMEGGREGGFLPLGANVRVQITAPQAEAIVVPKEAIVMRSGRKVVFTVENNEAKWHYVTTGAENQTEVAILEGLEAGKQVIISNNLQLVHDSPVKALKAP